MGTSFEWQSRERFLLIFETIALARQSYSGLSISSYNILYSTSPHKPALDFQPRPVLVGATHREKDGFSFSK